MGKNILTVINIIQVSQWVMRIIYDKCSSETIAVLVMVMSVGIDQVSNSCATPAKPLTNGTSMYLLCIVVSNHYTIIQGPNKPVWSGTENW